MRVLIACEFSGVVRDAFLARKHEAVSCDLEPTESLGQHMQCDVLTVLNDGWDMMIAFPPCTHLAASGARWFAEKRRDGRQNQGIEFFMALARAPIKKVCLENPVGIMSKILRPPDQIIQPWQHGHPESKATCLWLRGLPLLIPTKILPLPASGRWTNQTPSGQNIISGRLPLGERARLRSRTYPGIAAAMADQWG